MTTASSDEPPVTPTLVRQLQVLADTPFRVPLFRARWETFGWVHYPAADDGLGFLVRVAYEQVLTVDPLGDDVLCAYLSFYFWEDFELSRHHTHAEYSRQRAAYDEAFRAAAGVARATLSDPVATWTDADANAHKAMVWQGAHGLLILQQAAFDVQFGLEVNFWLTPRLIGPFRPTTPLIDWLCRRNKLRHETCRFPLRAE